MPLSNKIHFIGGLITGLLTTIIFITFDMPTYKSHLHMIFGTLKQNSSENITHQTEDFYEHDHRDNDFVARQIKEQIRILVGILTSPTYLYKRAQSVKDTWAKRCNKILYFSTEKNSEFPTIDLEVPEGYNHLTAKSMTGLQYIYEHYFNDFDWFMKADDDTYVIMENLRYFLSGQNTSEPVYFGQLFKPFVKQGYHSGGAGYVLSKEALRRFGERGNNSKCRKDGGSEDVEIGLCLESLGVRTGNSIDSLGRRRFHSFTPEAYLFGDFPKKYETYDSLGCKKGEESFSDYVISFHKINPVQMRQLEFYVYHLRPYGIYNGKQDLNINITTGN